MRPSIFEIVKLLVLKCFALVLVVFVVGEDFLGRVEFLLAVELEIVGSADL